MSINLISHLTLSHVNTLAHHVAQCEAWLALSGAGTNTTPLSYAALELRYAIERLAVHYWAGMVAGTPDESELLEIGSFKKIEARIYELAGHQLKINRGFDFAELLSSILGIKLALARPNMPLLRRHWHTCSEVCHIGWALATSVPDFVLKTHAELDTARLDIAAMVSGYQGIPRLDGSKMHQLQRDFIEGRIGEQEVREFVKAEGLNATFAAKPGAQETAVGTPIPAASLPLSKG